MSGTLQAIFQNQRSFGIAIGDAYQGGFFAGQISTSGNGIATHNLVVAPLSSGEFAGVWKTSNTSTAGTTSVIDGPSNTAAMISAGASAHPCGQFCDDLVVGGFSDWYMPAKNELEVCYYNLKPTTQSNFTNSGINTNAVPSRGSNYTTGTPAQTSATNFRDTGTEYFTDGNYWSSTQPSNYTRGAGQYFANTNGPGGQTNFYKTNTVPTSRVRAVRRVAV